MSDFVKKGEAIGKYVSKDKNAIISDKLDEIDEDSLVNCKNLNYIQAGNGLYLGDDNNPFFALVGTKSKDVKTININENTRLIAKDFLKECKNIKYNRYDNGLYLGNEKNPYMALVFPKDKSIELININENTKIICQSAFSGCNDLKTVIMPDSILHIGKGTFIRYKGSIIINSSNERLPDFILDVLKNGVNIYKYISKCPYCNHIKTYYRINFNKESGELVDYECFCSECKNPLSFAPGFYTYKKLKDTDSVVGLDETPEPSKMVDEFIDSQGKSIESSSFEINDYNALKEYFAEVIEIEKTTEVLKKLLEKAYLLDYATHNFVDFYQQKIIYDAEINKKIYEEKLDDINYLLSQRIDSEIKNMISEKTGNLKKPIKPKQPVLYDATPPIMTENFPDFIPESKPFEDEPKNILTPPILPKEPLYEKAGFFNKKKVEKNNQLLYDEYQEALKRYEDEKKIYEKSIKLKKEWKIYKESVEYNLKIKDAKQKAEDRFEKETEEYKSIQIENEKLLKRYEVEYDEYEKKNEEYQNEVNEIRNEAALKVEKKRKTLLAEKEKIERKINEYKSVQKISKDDLQGKKYQIYWDKEVERIQNLLTATISTRNELYSYDIIFPKYRHLAAVSTLYEYLISGRCSQLEGANGAYNLYEAEIRANIIIEKLDDVLVSLDEIKKNQFTLLNQLKEIHSDIKKIDDDMLSSICEIDDKLKSINVAIDQENENLRTINKTILKVGESINNSINSAANSIDSNLKAIESNTSQTASMSAVSAAASIDIAKNTKQIVYNTAETAYYSKVNAQLTHTLNYLVALH